MNEKIQKPITIVRQEFIDTISNNVNNCGLPLFVIEPILRDLYLEVKSLSYKQYEAEKAEYEQIMQKQNTQIGDANE